MNNREALAMWIGVVLTLLILVVTMKLGGAELTTNPAPNCREDEVIYNTKYLTDNDETNLICVHIDKFIDPSIQIERGQVEYLGD